MHCIGAFIFSKLLYASAPTSQPKLLHALAPTSQPKLLYTSAQTFISAPLHVGANFATKAPLHVSANLTPKAPLHICTNLSRGSGAQKHRELVCDLVDLLLLREVAAVFEGDDAVGGSWGEAKVNASVHLRADASILLAMENQ